MSALQLGTRLGMMPQSVADLEKSEVFGRPELPIAGSLTKPSRRTLPLAPYGRIANVAGTSSPTRSSSVLHAKLCGDVWTWAGDYRQAECNIGVDYIAR